MTAEEWADHGLDEIGDVPASAMDDLNEFEDPAEQFRDPAEFEPADDEPPLDALEEIAALEAAEAAQLAAARAELEAERLRTRAVLERYRDAVLASEPDLPPELVRGSSLDELDAAIEAARRTVADVRARLAEATAGGQRGFPIGAPARTAPSRAGLSAAEKIRRGLEERTRV